LFRSEGSIKELSGLPTIARISGEMLRRGWVAVISLMGMISLQLGIMISSRFPSSTAATFSSC